MSQIYITENGIIVPDTSIIKEGVTNEWLEIAGEDTTVDPSTFEGRLIDMFTNERVGVLRNDSTLANQLNPDMSMKNFLDAQLALIGSSRDSAERSTVECVLTGVVGTIILSGTSLAEGQNSSLWTPVSDVTIGSDNKATASFRCTEYGPINSGSGTINKIDRGVVGWETITNPLPATEGKLEQNDVSARKQRVRELGSNTRSVSFSVISAVNKLEGVKGVTFRENNTNAQKVIDEIVIEAHSSWICIDGGATEEIVNAYVTNRYGTGFVGQIDVPYVTPLSGQIITAKISRPTYKDLICKITARVGQSQDAIRDIKNAIINYADGKVDGEQGFYLGVDSSPFEVAAGVAVQLPDVFIRKCELAVKGGTLSTNTITNAIYEKANIAEEDIEVVLV